MIRTRALVIPALLTVLASSAFAQESSPKADTSAPAKVSPATTTVKVPVAAEGGQSGYTSQRPPSREIRNMFAAVLRDNPSELETILKLDPTLMSNQAFLAGYPDLARFIEQYPEVRQNPRFYLGDIEPQRESHLDKIMEGVMILTIFTLILSAIGWLVRALIDQKRWSRLSRTQSEVHNKIIDRFASSEELLGYVKSPAGSKFLESAPIPLRADQPVNAPVARVISSIQIGVIVALGAIGVLVASTRLDKDAAQGLFTLGIIALCVGGGFIVSAVVSMFVSRRLGLLGGRAELPAELGDSGLVR